MSEVEDAITAHARFGLLVDSHIIVLYVVGLFDATRISTFHRTRNYTSRDFDELVALFSFFERIIVTPHLLAEANSLLGQLPDGVREECRRSRFFDFVTVVSEEYIPSRVAAAAGVFEKLGLSDSTICAASSDYAVLTDDFALQGTLEKLGKTVINFNHIRDFS
jgi:hypothetical protein